MNKAIKKDIAKKIVKDNKIKKQQGQVCAYCNCNNPLILSIDHKLPRVRGGKDEPSNKAVSCIICNKLKDALTVKEFKVYMKNLVALRKLYKITVEIPTVNIKFNPHYYPEYFKNKLEAQPNAKKAL